MSKVAQDGLEWYKQVLEENSSYLVKELTLNSLFMASMVSRGILTYQEVEDIEVRKTFDRYNSDWFDYSTSRTKELGEMNFQQIHQAKLII